MEPKSKDFSQMTDPIAAKKESAEEADAAAVAKLKQKHSDDKRKLEKKVSAPFF